MLLLHASPSSCCQSPSPLLLPSTHSPTKAAVGQALDKSTGRARKVLASLSPRLAKQGLASCRGSWRANSRGAIRRHSC